MARLSDLDLGDDQRRDQAADARQLIRVIDDLLLDDRCSRMHLFLQDLRVSVDRAQRVTPKQKEAVLNIQRNASNRLEGWRRR